MGIAIPQVITPSKASGAQVIDGSLKFDQSKSQHLTRTFTGGNRRTWTHSSWVRQGDFGRKKSFFMVGPSSGLSNANYLSLDFDDNDKLRYAGGAENFKVTSQRFRDTGWYHVVWTCDTNEAASVDRTKIYVNGEIITAWSTSSSNPSQYFELPYNENSIVHRIGTSTPYNNDREWNDAMSQVYFIDGQALGPENFGFTDPLTNTWKPKKYNVPKADTVLVGTPTYASSDFKTTGDKTSDQTGLSFSSWSGSYTGAETKLFKNSTDSAFTLNINLVGGTTDRYLWGSNNLTNWTYIANAGARYYQLSGYKYYATSEGSSSTKLQAVAENGPNSFYLPFDGNSPIGKDQSGNGNDWTPVNFGGSVELDNPNVSGARPILNTTQGGAQAGVGVFGSKQNVGYAVTVYNDGGGNKYYIDGVKQDTVTGLIRGATYTFDTSDSTVSSHPFRFSATSNGSHGGGSEYTNGVAAITGAATTITVPHDAPNTLYYYCTSHSGMGADITGITTNEKLADQHASKCVLALPLVGSANDVSASIACTMTNKTVTTSGAVASSAFNNFYNGSFFFDGSNDSLSIADNTDFTVGSAPFTFEFWAYKTASGEDFFWGSSNSSGQDSSASYSVQTGGGSPSNSLRAHVGDGSGLTTVNSGIDFVLNKWVHIAFVRDGNTLRLFQDGVQVGTTSFSGTVKDSADPLMIGRGFGADSTKNFPGYIQDFRFYKGVAKYTSDFVVPSRSPDILPDTPSGVSGGSKLTKITDGAVTLEDNNDYLIVSKSSDLAYGTGDFTIEAYINLRSTPSANIGIIDQRDEGEGTATKILLAVNTDNTVKTFVDGSNQIITPAVVRPNTWQHIAYTRSGTTGRIFVDGILQASGTDSKNYSANARVAIGHHPTVSSRNFPGSISNLRIVKGTALYTSRFTPPTRTLTNVTNTKLLCCQSPTNVRLSPVGPNVGITTTTRFNSNFESIPTTVNGLTVTNNGSVTTTSAGTNSYGFTNCADLTGSNSLSVDLGTIPALTTIDLVFKVTGTSDNKYVFGIGGNGLVRRSSSSFDWYNGSDTDITTSEIADGNWHHLRVTPTRLYFDNTLIENNTSLQFINNNTTADGDNSGHMALGAFRNGSGTIQYNGAIDFGLVRVMPGVDLGAPSSYPITTNGTLSDTETIPSDGIIVARGDAAASTFNPSNTDINTVRGQETGHATFNPLDSGHDGASITFSDGNLKAAFPSTSGTGQAPASIYVSSGKWYCEYYLESVSDLTSVQYGIVSPGSKRTAYIGKSGTTDQYGWEPEIDRAYNNGTNTTPTGKTFTSQWSVAAMALDLDNGTWEMFIDGIPTGTIYSGISGTYTFAVGDTMSSGYHTHTANFGQKPFKFSPPDGFQPLNTANARPVKVISRPDQYVGVTTYSGNNTAGHRINVGFDPDLVIFGRRTNVAERWTYDTIRGAGYALKTSSDGSQEDQTGSLNFLKAFVDDGFTLGTDQDVNSSSDTYVTWNWRAGGSKNTFNVDDVGYATAAAAGLTGGDITPTGASVGTKQGFSIIKFTGSASGTPSIPHGLSKAPNFIAQKDTGANTSWRVFMYNGTTWSIMNFDHASGAQGATETAPTSSLFYANGNGNAANTQIAYLWHDVPGLQKFGTFEGNGNSNGPFVELGFRPSLILMRNLDNYGTNYDWCIYDNERAKFNPNNKFLTINLAKAENVRGDNNSDTSRDVDFLSNGFKIRNTASTLNLNSHTIFYAAWAEAPSVDLFGGGANAR